MKTGCKQTGCRQTGCKQTDHKQGAPRTDERGQAAAEQAVSEVMRLYTAWIAVLLKRLGTDVVRVGAGEITGALDGFSCTVSREGSTEGGAEGSAEGGEYVIRLCGAEGSADPTGSADPADGKEEGT